ELGPRGCSSRPNLPSTPTVTRDRNRIAVLTKLAAGRACSATESGSATLSSELVCTACLFRRPRHIIEVLPGRRHHRRRDRPLDERSIDESDVAVATAVFQQVADREDRAAEIPQHYDSLAP